MADQRSSMMEPPIEDLLSKVDSKFTLVTLAAKRARQINLYFSQLGDGLGTIVPPQVTSVSRKPLSIALEEVAAGKIVFTHRHEGTPVEGLAVEVPEVEVEAAAGQAQEAQAEVGTQTHGEPAA